MKDRNSRTATAAALQLLASYLRHDLEDLRRGGAVADEAARAERLRQLSDIAAATARGAEPVYGRKREERMRGGALVPEREEALATLDSDRETFRLVRRVRDEETGAVANFARQLEETVTRLAEDGWSGLNAGQQCFVADEVDRFLRRMGRLDQLPDMRARRRTPAATS